MQTQSLFAVLSPSARHAALLDLLAHLDATGYDFLAPTPATQARVMGRASRKVDEGVEDLLGWSLPVSGSAAGRIAAFLDRAGLLEQLGDGRVRSAVRVSRVFDNLFVHSAYPTEAQDAVFLGPDSHRFADYILRSMADLPRAARILDYGAGAGVGGITAAVHHGTAHLTLADLNPRALALASVNADHAGVEHVALRVERPDDLEGPFDLIVMHPPFMIDAARRAYRDGGDLYGGRLSVDWALAALPLLAPGGRLVMHTGVSIVGGRDVVHDALRGELPAVGYSLDYRLLDPDIYGDELVSPDYAALDRIAAVGLTIERTLTLADANG
ncbi:methyltransferase [Sphingomonas spermidinifaciens]|uniref:Methyltransferase n=1 Tax=Sphingomonas spermidinifaciens TaxID=1141889 RepID=A0A2A4AXZ3_9SPHN|nr:class I SAM-dependent methyltransferase [Sphingomonas spermidinifaciens]PCD01803.1 methyltransferase [Sphingomonas spermidinifaciens]